MPAKQAAAPAAKKGLVPKLARAKNPARRRAVRKSSRPAGDMRVTLADIAPAKRAARTATTLPAAADDEHKEKVVRDGFSMPRADYDKFRTLKAACLAGGVAVKKSELLRAGLQALEAMPVADLLARIRALPPIKAGRKKK